MEPSEEGAAQAETGDQGHDGRVVLEVRDRCQYRRENEGNGHEDERINDRTMVLQPAAHRIEDDEGYRDGVQNGEDGEEDAAKLNGRIIDCSEGEGAQDVL